MGHARAFARKLWKSTVTICEARLNERAETTGRAEGPKGGRTEGRKGGRGWQEFIGDSGWTWEQPSSFRAAIIDFSASISATDWMLVHTLFRAEARCQRKHPCSRSRGHGRERKGTEGNERERKKLGTWDSSSMKKMKNRNNREIT